MKYGTDYGKTAINLTNSNEVRNLLLEYGKAVKLHNAALDAYGEVVAELPEKVAADKAGKAHDEAYKKVKEAIDRVGSYQDIGEGLYAIKQSRTRTNYDPLRVRERLPQFAQVLINETVDGNKINGLKKGNLITEEDMARIEVRTELAPAYLIDLVKEEGANAD